MPDDKNKVDDSTNHAEKQVLFPLSKKLLSYFNQSGAESDSSICLGGIEMSQSGNLLWTGRVTSIASLRKTCFCKSGMTKSESCNCIPPPPTETDVRNTRCEPVIDFSGRNSRSVRPFGTSDWSSTRGPYTRGLHTACLYAGCFLEPR